MHRKQPEGLVRAHSESGEQGGAWDSAFITSSQVRLLVDGPHLRSKGARTESQVSGFTPGYSNNTNSSSSNNNTSS